MSPLGQADRIPEEGSAQPALARQRDIGADTIHLPDSKTGWLQHGSRRRMHSRASSRNGGVSFSRQTSSAGFRRPTFVPLQASPVTGYATHRVRCL